MTAGDKLEIVRRFKAGKSIWEIAFEDWKKGFGPLDNLYERIIRDYINGELESK